VAAGSGKIVSSLRDVPKANFAGKRLKVSVSRLQAASHAVDLEKLT
jgi:hypothetical protein